MITEGIYIAKKTVKAGTAFLYAEYYFKKNYTEKEVNIIKLKPYKIIKHPDDPNTTMVIDVNDNFVCLITPYRLKQFFRLFAKL